MQKECAADTFPLTNIHEHQVVFMEEFGETGRYRLSDPVFYRTKRIFITCVCVRCSGFGERADGGGRKRFSYDELDREYFLNQKNGLLVSYLDGLQKDLLSRGLTFYSGWTIIEKIHMW